MSDLTCSTSVPAVLLTGASGYIGGRLARRLIATGVPLRCMGRHADTLAKRLGPGTDVVQADVARREGLDAALAGIKTAYYLIHALDERGDFESVELAGARNFAEAAREAGVERIIYLGGLGAGGDTTSAHMRSREAVGEALRASGIPTIEFRASVVIGGGSLSFEMIRALVRRLPIMVAPTWVRMEAQPIAIDDVLAYLDEARSLPVDGHRIYEIGGADVLSYQDLMLAYAKSQGLTRRIINVPFLTPWLSSLWLALVTPLLARVGRKLIESICVASVVRDDRALADFSVRPMGIDEAIARADREEKEAVLATRWTDAASASGPTAQHEGKRFGARIIDERIERTSAPPARAFLPIQRIGGATGWYYGTPLWRLRGLIDKILGGVGLGRGRRHPEALLAGDTVDWWRVEAIEPGALLILRAEMRLPGRAWLRFDVYPAEDGNGSVIRQTAIFDPDGIPGLLYWYALYPIHEFIFAGMCRNIARAANRIGPTE